MSGARLGQTTRARLVLGALAFAIAAPVGPRQICSAEDASSPIASDASAPVGVEVTYDESQQITWYSPKRDPWRMYDFSIFPSIAGGKGGTRRMIVTLLVKDPSKGLPTSLQVDTGEETSIVPIAEAERADVHDSGCRVTQTIVLQNQASLVQQLADAAQARLTVMGYEHPVHYRMSTQDLADFRRIADLWKSHDRPPPPSQQGSSSPPAGAVVAGTGEVTNPELIRSSKVPPSFPIFAMGKRAYGRVVLQAIVRKDGTVGDIEVLKGSGGDCGFEESAINAVRKWRYKPGTTDGQPVDVAFTVVIDFVYPK